MDKKNKKFDNTYIEKPRYIFGINSYADVWLGEYALLSNTELLKAACEHPIDISLSDLGASMDWITICLTADGYNLKQNRDTISESGDFTWDFINPTDPKLVWYPRLNTYPCTMIGVGRLNPDNNQGNNNADNNKTDPRNGCLFLLAWGHSHKEDQGYTIFECAEILRDLGAQAVLLMDEGNDVFQYYFPNVNKIDDFILGGEESEEHSLVPPIRPQIRGTLSFWEEGD